MSTANTGSSATMQSRLKRFEDGPNPGQPAPSLMLPPRKTAAGRKAIAEDQPVTAERPRSESGGHSKVKPSNTHVPTWLIRHVTERCEQDGLSHGELIIVAIEAVYDRLGELLRPAAVAGGSVFKERRPRPRNAQQGPLSPLNYRLRQEDFQTLDELVEKFGASSRGHLISVALREFLKAEIHQ